MVSNVYTLPYLSGGFPLVLLVLLLGTWGSRRGYLTRYSIIGFTNKNTIFSTSMCTTSTDFRWSTIFKVMLELNWLSVLLIALGSSTLDDVGPKWEDKVPIVLSEAVVWEVRESVYNSSSSLLSSPFNMSDNCLKSDGPFDFRSAEAF